MYLTLMLLGLVTAAPAGETPPALLLQTVVQQTIDGFEPFPQPARHDLGGVRVGMDWALGAHCSDPELCTQRLARTAGYSFHFLRQRGGEAILSHAPGSSYGETSPNSSQRRAAVLAEADCKLTVLLRCPHAPTTNRLPVDGNLAVGLYRELPRAWHVRHVRDGVFAKTMPARVSEVVLPPLHAIDDAWRQARADALELADALGKHAVEQKLSSIEQRSSGLPGASRVRQWARRVHPTGQLPVEEAERFCQVFLRLAVSNPALTYANITARPVADGVELTGATNVPFLATAVRAALGEVGIERVTDRVRRLPDADRLGDVRFGACRVAGALTRSEPDALAALQTELLFGEPVYLLDRADSFLLVQGGDGYWGWVRDDAIQTLTEMEFTNYLRRPEAIVLRDVVDRGMHIPRGTRVRVGAANGDDLAISISAGEPLSVPRDAVTFPHERQPDAIAQRVRAALDLLHTPYVFGGRSPDGLDCSGLCMNVAARTGERIPRDARQQVLFGALAATAWFRDDLRAGDQVFFIDQSGKVYHTGIALNASHILHAAPPGVQIGSIRKGDRLYDTRLDRDLFIARRQ